MSGCDMVRICRLRPSVGNWADISEPQY